MDWKKNSITYFLPWLNIGVLLKSKQDRCSFEIIINYMPEYFKRDIRFWMPEVLDVQLEK